jgi:toxin YoeB
MGKFIIELTDTAKEHLRLHKKSGNKAAIKKIDAIFLDLENHPFEGVGQPEPLKYELEGFWSRKINQKDRMIYSVEQEKVIVEVVSAIGHYSDK